MLRTFAPDAFAFGLASWAWIGVRDMTPRFTTAFGDVFLESLEGWWLLDTIEGSLDRRWATAVDLYAELDSPDGRENILLEDIVWETVARGVPLQPDEVFTFAEHPALGGRMNADAVVPMRFELALHFAGQLHQQLLAPPPPAAAPLLLGHDPALGGYPYPEHDPGQYPMAHGPAPYPPQYPALY